MYICQGDCLEERMNLTIQFIAANIEFVYTLMISECVSECVVSNFVG